MAVLADIFSKLEKIIVKIRVRFINIQNIDNSRHDTKVLVVGDLSQLSSKQLKQLKPVQEILSDAFEKEKFEVIYDQPQTTIAEISQTARKNPEILTFIIQNLPSADHSLWLSGLTLREKSDAGLQEEVLNIKDQMIAHAGWRGASIANLANAGYLESHIIEIFKAKVTVSENGVKNGYKNFLEIYDEIVEKQSFIVFVSLSKSYADVKQEVISKISVTKQSGRNYVYIHAIGKSNVDRANEIVSEVLEQDKSLDADNVTYFGNNKHFKITIEL